MLLSAVDSNSFDKCKYVVGIFRPLADARGVQMNGRYGTDSGRIGGFDRQTLLDQVGVERIAVKILAFPRLLGLGYRLISTLFKN